MMLNMFMYLVIFIDFILIILILLPSNLYKFHPLLLSLILIFYIIFLVIKMNFFTNSYWYSYMLFLVMVGGLMILFMYFTSLMNNELFIFNYLYYIYFYLKFLFILMLIYFYIKYNILNIFFEYMEILNFNNLINNNQIFYFKNLMMIFFMDMNLYMLFYLFLMMICSVLICMKTLIPLRQMFNK
uniref:NADH dehydrogenase subunit 6 n=1 Tax=Pambolus sp. QL-2013 TaxID=1421597 RepID=A0A0A6ZLX5_9HYME|nr:NADH dehydrogenase subunit 6 [Pambolus sp. QL-2013]